MQAVFFPAKAAEIPLASKDEVDRYGAEQKRMDEAQKPLKDRLAEIEKPYRDKLIEQKKSQLPEYMQAALRTPAAERSEGQKLLAIQFEKGLTVEQPDVLSSMTTDDRARHQSLTAEIEKLEQGRPRPLPMAMSVSEAGREAPPSYFLYRGSAGNHGSLMRPGVLTVATEGDYEGPFTRSTAVKFRAEPKPLPVAG